MRDLGHIEGQNIVFEYRNPEGEVDRLPDLAAELVRLDASIIVTSTAAATSAVKRATSTIPILMVAINYDPIALGHVDNLARPGRNVTGLYFQHLELLAERFGLIKEMLPLSAASRVFDSFTTDQLEIVQAANQSVGLELQPLHLQNPPYDFENAFRAAARSAAEAIMVLESAPIFRGRTQIIQFAKDNRLPTSSHFANTLRSEAWFRTAQTSPPCIGGPPKTRTKYFEARNRGTCRSSSRRSLNWSSISKQPRRSTSRCRPRFSPAPTR